MKLGTGAGSLEEYHEKIERMMQENSEEIEQIMEAIRAEAGESGTGGVVAEESAENQKAERDAQVQDLGSPESIARALELASPELREFLLARPVN